MHHKDINSIDLSIEVVLDILSIIEIPPFLYHVEGVFDINWATVTCYMAKSLTKLGQCNINLYKFYFRSNKTLNKLLCK